jgi:hypothetical protein
MDQVFSIVGALLILAAYAGNQLALLDRRDRVYNLMNLVGAAVLVVIAWQARQWGFVLLEGVWTVLSVPPLLRRG